MEAVQGAQQAAVEQGVELKAVQELKAQIDQNSLNSLLTNPPILKISIPLPINKILKLDNVLKRNMSIGIEPEIHFSCSKNINNNIQFLVGVNCNLHFDLFPSKTFQTIKLLLLKLQSYHTVGQLWHSSNENKQYWSLSVGKAFTFKTKKCEFFINFPLTKENVNFYKQNIHFQFNYKSSQFYIISNSSNCYFQFQPILTYKMSPLNFFVFPKEPKEKSYKISSDTSNNVKFLNISSVKLEPSSEIKPLLFKFDQPSEIEPRCSAVACDAVENIYETGYNTSMPTVNPYPNSFYLNSNSKNILPFPVWFLNGIVIVGIILGATIFRWKKNGNKK